MSHANRGMMLKSASCQPDQLILEIRNFTDTAASKKFCFNRVCGKFCLACVYDNFSTLSLAVGFA